MQKYKVDWLAFSVAVSEDEASGREDKLLDMLGYQFAQFDEVPGRWFYNSGATFGGYVNVFWNDPAKGVHKNSSRTMTVVFTGQGSTDLAEKWKSDWLKLFATLDEYGGVNITRLDLAFDDYDETVKFEAIENKLNRGHYRSSRRSYNVVKTSDTEGRILGHTIYIGNARSDGGSRGNVYARFYDKKAQYEAKHQLFPSEVRNHWAVTGKEVWQRYEISYSKQYASKVVDRFLSGEGVDLIFKSSLRNLLEILDPKTGDTNKSRWSKTVWWEKFLQFDDTMDFGVAERDVLIGDLLEWLRVAVVPSLGLLEIIGEEKGFDIYEILRQSKKPVELSKKQHRLLEHSKRLPNEALERYLTAFFGESKGGAHGNDLPKK